MNSGTPHRRPGIPVRLPEGVLRAGGNPSLIQLMPSTIPLKRDHSRDCSMIFPSHCLPFNCPKSPKSRRCAVDGLSVRLRQRLRQSAKTSADTKGVKKWRTGHPPLAEISERFSRNNLILLKSGIPDSGTLVTFPALGSRLEAGSGRRDFLGKKVTNSFFRRATRKSLWQKRNVTR